MIKGSVPYTLCRIEDDSSLTPVSQYEDIVDAVVGGVHQVEVEDFDFSYAVYADGKKIHSLDDRYDHDVDELMA